jgi:tyrosine-protein phosphatase SIW14
VISQVDSEVWRGPRPGVLDYDSISAKFASVLSLEGLAEDVEEARGMPKVKLISFPITFCEIYFTGITQTYLAEIELAIMSSAKPLLIHCQHGQDRTGLVVGAYRVARSSWTKDAAWQEALKYGYRDWLNFGLNKNWKLL